MKGLYTTGASASNPLGSASLANNNAWTAAHIANVIKNKGAVGPIYS